MICRLLKEEKIDLDPNGPSGRDMELQRQCLNIDSHSVGSSGFKKVEIRRLLIEVGAR